MCTGETMPKFRAALAISIVSFSTGDNGGTSWIVRRTRRAQNKLKAPLFLDEIRDHVKSNQETADSSSFPRALQKTIYPLCPLAPIEKVQNLKYKIRRQRECLIRILNWWLTNTMSLHVAPGWRPLSQVSRNGSVIVKFINEAAKSLSLILGVRDVCGGTCSYDWVHCTHNSMPVPRLYRSKYHIVFEYPLRRWQRYIIYLNNILQVPSHWRRHLERPISARFRSAFVHRHPQKLQTVKPVNHSPTQFGCTDTQNEAGPST